MIFNEILRLNFCFFYACSTSTDLNRLSARGRRVVCGSGAAGGVKVGEGTENNREVS